MGDHPERLVALIGGGAGPAAVIANAMGTEPEDARRQGVCQAARDHFGVERAHDDGYLHQVVG